MSTLWRTTLLVCSALLFVGQGCVSLNKSKAQTSGPAGVFVTADKGENWSQLAALPTAEGVLSIDHVSVNRFFLDPQDPNAIYLGTRGTGLFYTYDKGRTWQQPQEPALQSGYIYSVAVHPKDKCVLQVTNGSQIFASKDCARTWKEVYRESRSGLTIQSIRFEPFELYRLLMTESNGDLLESRDGGLSWAIIHRFETNILNIEPDPHQQGVFYVTTRENGIFRSRDGAVTWDSLADNMKEFTGSLKYRGFVLHPERANIIYWLSTYGILMSRNGGNTWEDVGLLTPPGSVNIYAFGVNPQNPNDLYYTATLKDLSRSTFYRSIDGGKNWTTKKLPTGQVPIAMHIHADGELVYLGFVVPPQK